MNSSAINPASILLALLLHAAVFATLFIGLLLTPAPTFNPPLTIKATLTQIPDVIRAPVEQAPPDPAPEPVREEPEPEPPAPEPDVDERRILEQQKLEQERLAEQQRLEEQRKQQEEERRQKALEEQRRREEADQKRRDEEELERKRRDAEEERQREIERQRAENERQRREEEEVALATAIAAEEALNEARDSDEMAAYLFALRDKVRRNWSPPPSRRDGLNCEVRVRQTRSGDVQDVRVLSCNGDAAVERSIEAAVRRAAPLPVPENSLLFEPTITFVFRPDD